MINRADITKAIVALLEDQLPPATDDGKPYQVERANFAEMNPEAAPWIGVYRDGVEYDPATIASGGRNLKGELVFRVIVLAASYKDGADAEDLLCEYETDVLNALKTDFTLGGTVDQVTGLTVEDGFNEFDSETLRVQYSMISIQCEKRTA